MDLPSAKATSPPPTITMRHPSSIISLHRSTSRLMLVPRLCILGARHRNSRITPPRAKTSRPTFLTRGSCQCHSLTREATGHGLSTRSFCHVGAVSGVGLRRGAPRFFRSFWGDVVVMAYTQRPKGPHMISPRKAEKHEARYYRSQRVAARFRR